MCGIYHGTAAVIRDTMYMDSLSITKDLWAMSSVILVWFPKTAVLIPAGRSSATHKA
jgi:hypothetical protein